MKWLVNGHEVELGGQALETTALADRVQVRTAEGSKSAVVLRQGEKVLVSFDGSVYECERVRAGAKRGGGQASGEFKAPMPGLVVDVLVQPGDSVVRGQKLLVLEAMKTQQPVVAPFDGTVETLGVQKKQQVSEGHLLVIVRENAEKQH